MEQRVVIVGGGIGGLTAALCLHSVGIESIVYEQAPEVRELGVGINVLPTAVAVLDRLGLTAELDSSGVRTAELLLCTRDGVVLQADRRGIGGGHAHPQYSIHRGQLQGILYRAVLDRLGADSVRTGQRLDASRHRREFQRGDVHRIDGNDVDPRVDGRGCRRNPLGRPLSPRRTRGTAALDRRDDLARGDAYGRRSATVER